jgi:hypothetical protein
MGTHFTPSGLRSPDRPELRCPGYIININIIIIFTKKQQQQQQQQHIKFYATGGFLIRNTTLRLRDYERRHIVDGFL